MKKIENGNFHHTLMSALSFVLLMAVAGGISEHMLLWNYLILCLILDTGLQIYAVAC